MECPNGAKLIPLTRGQFAIVDAEDYSQLCQHKWCLSRARRTCYTQRHFKLNGRWTGVSMHRHLVTTPPGMEIDHINHNGLDNRRCNLRVCTHSENMKNQRPKKRGYKWLNHEKKVTKNSGEVNGQGNPNS